MQQMCLNAHARLQKLNDQEQEVLFDPKKHKIIMSKYIFLQYK